jgi:hypothetical protein
MARFAFFAFIVVCTLVAVDARAADAPAAPVASGSANSVEAGRLLAREIAIRAQGGGFANGRFSPVPPHPTAAIPAAASAPTPAPAATPACGDVKGLAADVTDTNGMHFMPIRRDNVRQFKMPTRSEATMRAQALQAAIAGGKGESELAQAALQADAQASPAVQAQAELAKVTGAPAPAPSADELAKEAVLHEIQKYRSAHGNF